MMRTLLTARSFEYAGVRKLVRAALALGVALPSAALLLAPEHAATEKVATLVPGPVKSGMRFVRSAACGALIAADYKWSLWGVGERDPRYGERVSRVHLRSARRLLRLFEGNRGIFIKAGQHMAALSYVLPPEYVDTMRVLHDRAPAMPAATVREVLRRELGRDPEEVFEAFDPVPLAAASLAQVHAAVLDGSRVAVKVQFPDVRETCAGDTRTIGVLLAAVTRLFPEFKLGWLVEEFRCNLPLELDFRQEVRNSERVRANFADRSAELRTPLVHHAYSTERVITMEFIDGVKANDHEGLVAMGLDVARVATLIADLFSIQVFEHGFVHCDPHPGNILVTKSEEGLPVVQLLDHGLYKELPESFRLDYCRLWKSIIDQDVKAMERASRNLGVKNYPLFCCILTARAWETVVGAGLQTDLDPGEREILKESASKYAAEITQILDVVPQELLLLLKLNDNLRSINVDLGSPVNTHSISLHHCLRILNKHELESAHSFVDKLWFYKSMVLTQAKLWIFDVASRLIRFIFG